MEKIASKDSLLEQAQRLMKRKFNPGFDKMTAETARIWITIHADRLIHDLNRGRYDPMPAIGFRIAKQDGQYRRLARLTALDTIIQHAMLDALSDPAETLFSDFSHAYRPNRGVATALEQYCRYGSGYHFAAKLDPVACFDNLDHHVLKETIPLLCKERAVIDLILRFAKMPVLVDDELVERERGVLQGSPLSGLLCNLYFHPLDEFLTEHGILFVRYADDLVLFSDSPGRIREAFQLARQFLVERLHLEPNEKKCAIKPPTELVYLGHKFQRDRFGLIALDTNVSPSTAYFQWHESIPQNNRRIVDILSDGILRQKDYSLLFESDRAETDIPIHATDMINIYSNVIFDTGFLDKALNNGILINVHQKNGRLIGQFTPHTPLKSPRVTFEQLNAYYDPAHRLTLARQFVLASIHNLRLNLRYYSRQRKQTACETELIIINAIAQKIKAVKTYEDLLLLEGQVRKHYYSCYDHMITADDFVFERRTRQPPKNRVNAMLSFGNVVLYNLFSKLIYRSPLDIRVGYLHATNQRMESLNLDLAEILKPLVVDRTILALINRRSIQKHHFTVEDTGTVYLNEKGKQLFLSALYDKLDTMVTVHGEKLNYHQIMAAEVQKLVRHFKTGEKYVPFKQVR
jgi:CRISPR-associated endonuclease Cas1 subtype I-B